MLDINVNNLCFCYADSCDEEFMEQTDSMVTRMYFRHFLSNYQYRTFNMIVKDWYWDDEQKLVMTKYGYPAVRWVIENLDLN